MNEEQEKKEELANSESTGANESNAESADKSQDDLRKEILQEEDSDQDQLNTDLSDLSLTDLFKKGQEALMHRPKVAMKWLNTIRPVFFDKFHEEKKTALEAYMEEAEDAEGFVFEYEKLADELNEIIVKAKEARTEEKKRIEEEKQKNLKRKEALLDTLSSLLETDETEDSIQQVKEIQKEWKNIRALPKDKVQDLWDKYHMLLDTFYDNHSINIELKELDRKKNLEQKIELTKKVDALASEKSLKKSFILLNKYHEEFKNIGPVPQESREGIWQAFKAASDKIYEIKREIFEKNQAKRQENLEQKKILVEKMTLVAQPVYDQVKDWNQKTKEVEDLFQQWRAIGPVPKANSDEIWSQFKEQRNTFYNQRKNYFREDYKRKKANLILKEDLCKRVENIKDNENFNETTQEILNIQKEWKKIGPVPDKVNQAIWNRFRAACDHFFNRKQEAFSSKIEEEKENLEKKKQLIQKLEELGKSDKDEQKVFDEFKTLSSEWKQIGFVPRKSLRSINKSFDDASDAIFKKFNKKKEDLKISQLGDHYSKIIHTPNGKQRIQSEEYKIKKRINFLNEEILNLEQNMSFFAKSKTADKLLKDFEQKLEKAKSQIERLKEELKVIRGAKHEAKKEQEQEETVEESKQDA
ncbi:DUF349 domain-containing protein [bacterium]|nr:DUF349 domain-containing protein [bacterium]